MFKSALIGRIGRVVFFNNFGMDAAFLEELHGWNKEVVVYGTFGNMVLGSNGYPHFLYHDNNNTLIYTSWDGSNWNKLSVTSNGSFGVIDNFGYLALDTQNRPHIDFGNNYVLMYATFTGTNWDIQKISDNAFAPGPIVIDSKGNPHISFGGIMTLYAASYQMYATITTAPATPLINSIVAIAVIVVLAVALATSLLLFRRQRKTAKPSG